MELKKKSWRDITINEYMPKDDKVSLKKTSWKDVTINEYFEIQDIMKDDTMEPADKEVELMSILSGLSTEQIWDMTITEFKALQELAKWVETATLRPLDKVKFNKIKINDTQYVVNQDLTKFTVAQYVDFETLWHNRDNKDYMGALLACFLIPKGKEYANDYDINKTKDDIMSYLDIQTAYEIMGFFLVSWRNSTKASLDSLSRKMKKMKKKMTVEEWNQHTEKLETLEKNILGGFQLLTQ